MSTDQPAPPSIPPRKPPGAPRGATGAGAGRAGQPAGQPAAAPSPAAPSPAAPSPAAPAPGGPRRAPGSAAAPGRGRAPRPVTTDVADAEPPRAAAPGTGGPPTGRTATAPPSDERDEPVAPAGTGAGAGAAAKAKAAAAGGLAAAAARRALRGATTVITGTAPGTAADHAAGPTPTGAGGTPRAADPKDPTISATDTATRPSRPAPAASAPPRDAGPRRVRLALSRIDPWSVMKLSFLLSFAVGVMIVVAAAVVWLVLDNMAVFTTVNDMIREIVGEESPIDLLQFLDFSRVISGAAVIAIVDVVLLTALSTLGAFLYNITAALVGGVNVTLTDE